MSIAEVIKEEVIIGKELACPDCKSEIEYIISETNSQYYYCRKCNDNCDVIDKHVVLDKGLKSIQNHLSNININNIEEVKICISICNEYMDLCINDERVSKIELLNNINDKDISMLKSVIEYILEDTFGEGRVKSKINIYI